MADSNYTNSNMTNWQDQIVRWSKSLGWTQVNIGTASKGEVELGVSPIPDSNRQVVVVTNQDASNNLYVGPSGTVSSTNFAYKISAGGTEEIPVGGAIELYFVADGTSTAGGGTSGSLWILG